MFRKEVVAMQNTVTRYQPQPTTTRLPDLVSRLFNESFVMPSLFDSTGFGGTARPSLPVNLYESTESYVLQAALPGLDAENLEIKVTGREIAIKGQFQSQIPENVSPIWQGIPTGQFYESYTLPADLDSEKVEATYEHGILWLTLPKAEHMRPKQVKVSVKS
jgi:HSP20 family protein